LAPKINEMAASLCVKQRRQKWRNEVAALMAGSARHIPQAATFNYSPANLLLINLLSDVLHLRL